MILIPHDKLTSPKLLQFVKAFQEAEEKQEVLAKFWKDVEKQGTAPFQKF